MGHVETVGLILHFRTSEQTLVCLRSLCAEGMRSAILVDNSQDGGRSMARMQAPLEALIRDGLHVDVLTPPCNLGFAGGVCAGLEHIRETHPARVLLINTDARLMHGSLEAMLGCLMTDRDVVAPGIREDEAETGRPLIAHYQRYLALYLRKRRMGTVSYPSGCCLLLGLELLDAQLFDTDFFFYGEDVMLGEYLRGIGARIVPCTRAAVVHVGSLSSRNGSLFYEYHMVRAHWLLAGKLGDNRFQKWAGLACRCLTLPARAVLRTARGRSFRPVYGLWLASSDLLLGRFRDLTPPPE